jgi:hypothetical protein
MKKTSTEIEALIRLRVEARLEEIDSKVMSDYVYSPIYMEKENAM